MNGVGSLHVPTLVLVVAGVVHHINYGNSPLMFDNHKLPNTFVLFELYISYVQHNKPNTFL